MKKFLLFICVILFFSVVSLFVAEKTDVFGFSNWDTQASFDERDGKLTLHWKRLPYPCLYKVESFSQTTGLVPDSPKEHLLTSSYTLSDSFSVPGTAIPVTYRVTAYGIFGRIAGPSKPIANPDFASDSSEAAPVSIFHYTEESPASLMPFLVWHMVPGAVCYEVELLAAPPQQEGGTKLDPSANHLESTHAIFTNGWQADLRPYRDRRSVWYRVRALNLHLEPIGGFSQAEEIHLDPARQAPNRPMLNNFDQMPDFEQPLYPVYHWIPLHNIEHYEVELLTEKPAEEHGTKPSPERVWHKTVHSAMVCYDEYPRPYAGDYYWRVRAVDKNGNTIGTWSDTEHFVVASHAKRVRAAALGDSITHGGGAVSNPPSALEYSYTTYLDFPCINLGRSGDTSHTTLLRFDQDVLPFQPENLLILTGSNSLRANTMTAESIIHDLASIQEKCEANDIRPIFLTLMPIHPNKIRYAFHTDTDPMWPEKLKTVNAWIKQQKYHIDLEPYFYDATGTVMDLSFSSDGLHPDIRGKMLMAEIINAHQDLLK